jgi:hypothetical protein
MRSPYFDRIVPTQTAWVSTRSHTAGTKGVEAISPGLPDFERATPGYGTILLNFSGSAPAPGAVRRALAPNIRGAKGT